MARLKRASVADWQGLEKLDHRELTNADIDAILRSVRTPPPDGPIRDFLNGESIERREALKKYLGYTLADYVLASRSNVRPSQRKEIEAFARIGARAEDLLESLNALDASGAIPRVDFERVPPLVRVHLVARLQKAIAPHTVGRSLLFDDEAGGANENARQTIRSALDSIHLLAMLARDAERDARAHTKKPAGTTTGRNVALDRLFEGLALIYESIWQRKRGRSVGGEFGARGEEGGPFVRFCEAVLPFANVRLTRAAVGDRVKRMRARMG